jgi:asparagine synthase (glutamine-hydrolysing)
MCGIVGAIDWGDRGTLQRMNAVQSHRGPDDAGLWERRCTDGTWVGFGNRRLAIIDLSPAGHMPMSSDDERYCITYNGEIYNFPELRRDLESRGHTFRSRTDTEVVLRLYQEYGPDCVKKLNGMFAFAVWDNQERRLFLARDHFGIKPLYWVRQGKKFAFASELKSLLTLPDCPREISLQSLDRYLTFVWIPEPETLFREIHKLPAGHYGIWKDGNFEQHEYWDLHFPRADEPYTLSRQEIIEGVRERLRESVKRQMVSDVPLGAFLSSGLDSSSIVAFAAQASSRPLRTYNVSFPTRHRVGENTLDDPKVAREVAQHFGCDHHEIVVERDVATLLPDLVWHMDDPVADPAILLAYLICRESRPTATVLLSGIGGDELFAGYRKHVAYRWSSAYQKMPRALRHGVIEPGIGRLGTFRGSKAKGFVRLAKKMARSGSLSAEDGFLTNCTYMAGDLKHALYSSAVWETTGAYDAWSIHREYFRRVHHADFLNQMLYSDTKTFMASLNLNYNDKMSMASSTEVRVPFLDRELAEFAATQIPPSMKLRGGIRPVTKYVLREAMKDILPKSVFQHPKAGFGAPIDYWLTNDLKEMTQDLLAPARVAARGYFNAGAVQSLLHEQQSGRRDYSMQIWQLLTLELWMMTFLDHDGTAPVTTQATRTSQVAQ